MSPGIAASAAELFTYLFGINAAASPYLCVALLTDVVLSNVFGSGLTDVLGL
jgi:hypothetical protein